MKRQSKNILAVAGVICSILGIVAAIPSFLKEVYAVAIGAVVLIVAGLVLLAIAFGD